MKISKRISPFAEDFLKELLNKNPVHRLGANGIEEIFSHPFLETINWRDLSIKNVKAPYVPRVKSNDWTKYIAENWLEEPIESLQEDSMFTTEEKRECYMKNFTFCGEDNFLEKSKFHSSDTTPSHSNSDMFS